MLDDARQRSIWINIIARDDSPASPRARVLWKIKAKLERSSTKKRERLSSPALARAISPPRLFYLLFSFRDRAIARRDKDDGLTGRQMRVMRRQTRLEGRIRIEPGF